MQFTRTHLEHLEQVLAGDYELNKDTQEIEFSMRDTDWTCYNIMTFDGSDNILNDDDGYYIEGDITMLPEGDACEDDIVKNYNNDESWEDFYQQLSENNIVWVHEVHTGSLIYSLADGSVYSGCNDRYCAPEAYVMKDGVLCPLEVR